MKILITFCMAVLLFACGHSGREADPGGKAINDLRYINIFTSDSMVNVVIEIPAGTNQKWEWNQESGHIEWEQIAPDSFRTIDYLPYPANYGFVPQTLLPECSGGDGDPVDVFVLGPAIARSEIAKVKIIGIIHMIDNNQSDSKILAVDAEHSGLNIQSFSMLTHGYPGILDILKIWLQNYKGSHKVDIISVNNEKDAMLFLTTAHHHYLNANPK